MIDFDYAVPTSLSEAVSLMGSNGGSARMLAGGTDLLIMMRAGRRLAKLVVDAKSVPELNELSLTDSGLNLGAATSCKRIWDDEPVVQAYPALNDSASIIGSVQIQGRASVGGNLCNAAPSADCTPTLIVHSGVCTIAGPNGTRQVPVEEFCTGPGTNVLQPGELLVNIKLPSAPTNSGAHYLRFTPRNEMDIAVAGSAAFVQLDESKQNFASARISLAAVAPTPLFAKAAGDLLVGKPVNEESIQQAAEAAKAVAKPITDMRGTVDQRIHLVGVLTARALRKAVERAREA